MKDKGLVSVIVPVYNVEKYLRQCLDSIVSQTYENLEIILVDDGSTDNSLAICHEYENRDSRIFVIHQKNRGAYKARKAAIERATGKYVAFIDGDDWIAMDMYYDLVEIMENYNTSMVESGIIDVYGNEAKKRKQKVKQGHYTGKKFVKEILPYMLYSGVFFESLISPNLWNKLFLKKEVKNIFDSIQEGGKMANDMVITYPYLIMNNDIYITEKSYYHYRVVNGSITRSNYSNICNELGVHLKVTQKFFEQSIYKNILLPQLYMHKLRMYAMYCPEIFDSTSDQLLNIYGGISANEKVIIYGAGKSGVKAYAYISNHMKENIVAWVDKNYKFLSKEIDSRIQNPKEVDYKNVDKVIITVLRAEAVSSIKEELKEMGVAENKINWIPEHFLRYPHLLLEQIEGRGCC